jgi:phosphoadenosine phosphosulfate reductase
MTKLIKELNRRLEGKNAVDILREVISEFPGKVTFGTSLGAEDQVILDMLTRCSGDFSVFTLDTGRLFPETYDLINRTNKKYGLAIEIYFPDSSRVEEMVNSRGINLFYDSVENRKLCCHVRKIVPLRRALTGKKIWIAGLRKDQSLNRFYSELVEWDEKFSIIKLNPLLKWTEKDVWSYIRENDVPYNPLHDKDYPSIGCQPCTRAIKPGEDIRAGRWWWEPPEHNECGLHSHEES